MTGDLPPRIFVERDEETNEKRWFSILGMGVEYVPASALEALRADNERLKAAIFGGTSYDPTLKIGNFVEMARSTEAGRLGAIARAERAEASLAGRDAEIAKAVAEEREACAKLAEDEMPATQDMDSTFICDALERTAAAIRARAQEPRS